MDRKFVPKQYRLKHDKAMRGRSLREAVNMFCLECVGFVRNEVKDCTNEECYLWKLRPYKGNKK